MSWMGTVSGMAGWVEEGWWWHKNGKHNHITQFLRRKMTTDFQSTFNL